MTPNEITTLIASNLDKEMDEPFKLMMIKRVDYWRSRLIKNSVDKDEQERKFFKQTLYLTMEEKNEVLCKVPYCQCKVSVTKVKLPKPARANGILFDYVGAIDGNNAFKYATTGMLFSMMQSKYASKFIYYTYENGYIKVYNSPGIPMIRVDGIFDNPEEATKLTCQPPAEACNYWDTEYPVTGDIMQLIVQSILQVDFNRKAELKQIEVPVTQQSDNIT